MEWACATLFVAAIPVLHWANRDELALWPCTIGFGACAIGLILSLMFPG